MAERRLAFFFCVPSGGGGASEGASAETPGAGRGSTEACGARSVVGAAGRRASIPNCRPSACAAMPSETSSIGWTDGAAAGIITSLAVPSLFDSFLGLEGSLCKIEKSVPALPWEVCEEARSPLREVAVSEAVRKSSFGFTGANKEPAFTVPDPAPATPTAGEAAGAAEALPLPGGRRHGELRAPSNKRTLSKTDTGVDFVPASASSPCLAFVAPAVAPSMSPLSAGRRFADPGCFSLLGCHAKAPCVPVVNFVLVAAAEKIGVACDGGAKSADCCQAGRSSPPLGTLASPAGRLGESSCRGRKRFFGEESSRGGSSSSARASGRWSRGGGSFGMGPRRPTGPLRQGEATGPPRDP